jgi:hypothetical protein
MLSKKDTFAFELMEMEAGERDCQKELASVFDPEWKVSTTEERKHNLNVWNEAVIQWERTEKLLVIWRKKLAKAKEMWGYYSDATEIMRDLGYELNKEENEEIQAVQDEISMCRQIIWLLE